MDLEDLAIESARNANTRSIEERHYSATLNSGFQGYFSYSRLAEIQYLGKTPCTGILTKIH